MVKQIKQRLQGGTMAVSAEQVEAFNGGTRVTLRFTLTRPR